MIEDSTAAQVDDNMPPLEEVETVIEDPKEEELATPEAGGFVDELDEATQARVNKLTFEKHEQKRRADAAEKALQEFQANNAPPEQAPPKLDDYDFDEAKHNQALAEYYGKKAAVDAVSDYKTEQQKAEAGQRQTEINSNFNARVEDLRKTVKDYDAVIAGLPDLPSDVLDEIMQHDKGPQLAHYLGKHLDVAENITLMKLGEISAQLANVKPIKQLSAAPDPIEPVKPGGTLNKSLDDMSMDEIYAIE